MRVIIAGSRSLTNCDISKLVRESGFNVTTVLSGTAKGVDEAGETWALKNTIPLERYSPDYHRYGRGAPIRRNDTMVSHADALIALWDGHSRGTKDVVSKALRKNLKLYVKTLIDEDGVF